MDLLCGSLVCEWPLELGLFPYLSKEQPYTRLISSQKQAYPFTLVALTTHCRLIIYHSDVAYCQEVK